jgi:DNA-binding IclR family transcriptional regulator
VENISTYLKDESLRGKVELILTILGSYLEFLSVRDLSTKAKISEAKTKYILSILEKRGYLRKAEDTGEYVLSEKILTLV